MSASVWRHAISDWQTHLAMSNRSQATCDGYVKHLEWLAAGVQAGPWQLTYRELAEWLDSHNWSKLTRRKVLVSLRAFYSWGTAQGFVEWAPTAGLPSAVWRSGPARLHMPPVWIGPVSEYLQWLAAGGRRDGTLDQYRWRLGVLAEVAADPWTVTTQQLAVFLSNPDWSAETKRMTRTALRSFYGWAVKAGYIETSPATDLDVIRIPRGLPRPAPAEAVRVALAASDDRVRLAVMLASYAGLRRAEIAGLHDRHVSDAEILVTGKGGHQRRVPLHPDLDSAIALARRRREVELQHDEGWLFPSPHGGHLTAAHLGKLVAEALPGEWTTHTLRHRFATAAYQVDRDLRAVQELLGHTKPETTARYAAVPEGALRSAVAGVGV